MNYIVLQKVEVASRPVWDDGGRIWLV